jgi:small nuclear ribonucleoprotein (snRNP)-like protein
VATITRHSNTCTIKQVASGREVSGEIMAFSEGRNLTVVMNKSVKIMMTWNGRMYEGRIAGMDFTSDGPQVSKTQTGR